MRRAWLLLLLAGCAARPPAGEASAALWLGGDVHLGARGVEVLAALPELTRGEPLVVNLEGPIGDGAASARRLVNGPQAPGVLSRAGVRVAGVENNHADDLGARGRARTSAVLEAGGVQVAGMPEALRVPARADTRGAEDEATDAAADVVTAGATDGAKDVETAGAMDAETAGATDGATDGIAGPPAVSARRAGAVGLAHGAAGPARLAVGGVPVVVVAVDLTGGVPERLAASLRATRRPGEVLVATFHVSAPGMVLPTEELETAVAAALDAGATVIASHGTHVPARVERRGGAVIAWGLGNLAFDCDCTNEDSGLLVRVAFAPDGRVARATVVPVDAGLHGAPVRPAQDAALALDVLEALGSSPLTRTADRADF